MTNILNFLKMTAGANEVKRMYAGSVRVAEMWENLFTNPSFENSDISMFSGGTFARSTAWAVQGSSSLEVTVETTYALPTPGVEHTIMAVARYAGQGMGGQNASVNGETLRAVTDQPVPVGAGFWDRFLVIEGNYSGGYFDGGYSSNGTPSSWTGAPNASTSKWWGGP